jgi:hypothetical protein
MREVIERFFAGSPAERREMSERTRAWVEDFHGFPTAGRALVALYERCTTGGGRDDTEVPAVRL